MKFGAMFDDLFSEGFKGITTSFNKKFNTLDSKAIADAAEQLKVASDNVVDLGKDATKMAQLLREADIELKKQTTKGKE